MILCRMFGQLYLKIYWWMIAMNIITSVILLVLAQAIVLNLTIGNTVEFRFKHDFIFQIQRIANWFLFILTWNLAEIKFFQSLSLSFLLYVLFWKFYLIFQILVLSQNNFFNVYMKNWIFWKNKWKNIYTYRTIQKIWVVTFMRPVHIIGT